MGLEEVTCKRGVTMKHKDLGVMRGPVLLFGGPYSNFQSFEALVTVTDIAPPNMICTGDVVAYCADTDDTIRRIQGLGCPVLAGNCEKQLSEDADNCGCGFEEGSQCSILAKGWYPHALQAVSGNQKTWMANLPDIISFIHNGKRYAVIHGGFTDISRFIWSTSPDAVFTEEITAIEAAIGSIDTIVAGHSGIPFIKEVANKTWINAGAIGMPPNDGKPQTRFVLLDQVPEIHKLHYDWKPAQAAMQAAGLTQGYEIALETGYWPSEDVLPPELKCR